MSPKESFLVKESKFSSIIILVLPVTSPIGIVTPVIIVIGLPVVLKI